MRTAAQFLLAAVAAAGMSSAIAGDQNPQFPIKTALDKGQQYKDKLGSDIALYFGPQRTPGIERRIGEWTATRNSNSANKPDQEACDIAFIGSAISLQDRARKEGGDAVINIKSLNKAGDSDSESNYVCTSGRVIARVQLRGTVVKLGKGGGTAAKKK